jgi:hypothetical protein
MRGHEIGQRRQLGQQKLVCSFDRIAGHDAAPVALEMGSRESGDCSSACAVIAVAARARRAAMQRASAVDAPLASVEPVLRLGNSIAIEPSHNGQIALDGPLAMLRHQRQRGVD